MTAPLPEDIPFDENNRHIARGDEATMAVRGLLDQCRDIFAPESIELMRWKGEATNYVVLVYQRTHGTAIDATAVLMSPSALTRMHQMIGDLIDRHPDFQGDPDDQT